MQKEMIVVRKVDRGVYKRFRQKALEEETTVGEAVTEAMKCWLEEKQKKNRIRIKNLLKLDGFIKVGRWVKWSEQVDDALYGGSS